MKKRPIGVTTIVFRDNAYGECEHYGAHKLRSKIYLSYVGPT